MAKSKGTIVFIHGLWLHACSWQNWEKYFQKAGYETIAPGWPGEPETVKGANADPQSVAGYGLEEVTEHYQKIVKQLKTQPILIGHSFGGLIVQQLMGMGLGKAGVALDPAPGKGIIFLPPAALKSASVVLKNPANWNRSVSLTSQQFRNGFANTVSQEESDKLYKKMAIPSPGRPLFEAAIANLNPNSPAAVNTKNPVRGPLLITGGGHDRTVPASVSRAAYKLYRKSPAVTDYKEYSAKSHALGIDSGWQEVAHDVLAWITRVTK
jgi:non-heme chloroperoxidase